MLRHTTILVASCLFLGACSSGGGSTSSGAASGGAAMATSTLFGTDVDSKVPVQSHSASLDEGTALVRAYDQDFSFRSRDENGNGEGFRRIHYGKPFPSYHPHRNYTIPIAVTNSGGETIGTGTATFTGTDVESGVTSRTITLTDVELTQSIFGLFSTDDTGSRGDFFEVHAYSTGTVAPSNPGSATYTGSFLADVISDGATGATRINLPANLTVDFDGNSVSGTMGSVGSPDITLAGTVNGASMTGTATITSGTMTLANGSAGTFNGSFHGNQALEATGTLGISDKSGAINHEMVGAFGATQN